MLLARKSCLSILVNVISHSLHSMIQFRYGLMDIMEPTCQLHFFVSHLY